MKAFLLHCSVFFALIFSSALTIAHAQDPGMMAAQQAMPTVKTTPLTATAQQSASQQQAGANTIPVPQANAGATAPLFSLGGGQNNWMLPQAQQQSVQGPAANLPMGASPQAINAALAQANGIMNTNLVYTGQRLVIPS